MTSIKFVIVYNLYINYDKFNKNIQKMTYKNIAYISLNNDRAASIITKLKEIGAKPITDVNSPDVIIVIGGDGTMLHSIHKYMHLNVAFYGINTGNLGFLMNHPSSLNNLKEQINTSAEVTIHPLQMKAFTSPQSDPIVALAINEISLLRETYQSAKLKIHINNELQIPELVSDGILVSTPAGSTAYNLSVGGQILPIDSSLLAITPISPFRPRRWRGALLSHNTQFDIEIIDHEIRPVSAVADFHEVRNIKSVSISEAKDKKVKLLFDSEYSFEQRVIREQFAY